MFRNILKAIFGMTKETKQEHYNNWLQEEYFCSMEKRGGLKRWL